MITFYYYLNFSLVVWLQAEQLVLSEFFSLLPKINPKVLGGTRSPDSCRTAISGVKVIAIVLLGTIPLLPAVTQMRESTVGLAGQISPIDDGAGRGGVIFPVVGNSLPLDLMASHFYEISIYINQPNGFPSDREV